MKNLVCLFASAMIFSACDTSEPPTPPTPPEPEAVHVTGVEISAPTLPLIVGDERTLTATVIPANADDKSVSWTNSDPTIATFDAATGEVKAVAEGTTTITVTTTDGAKTASCTVTVSSSVAEVSLTEENANRFDEYLDELLAEHPDGKITLNASDHAVTVSMENLAKLTCENIPTDEARIIVKDSKIKIARMESRSPEWSYGTGFRTAEWFWLSETAGVTPEIFWYGEKYINDFAPIRIAGSDKNIVSDQNGKDFTFGDFIMVLPEVLPRSRGSFVDAYGQVFDAWWSLDMSTYAIYADEVLNEHLIVPSSLMDIIFNSNTTSLYLNALAIMAINVQSDAPSPVKGYRAGYGSSRYEHAKLDGKTPITRPAWAQEWVPPLFPPDKSSPPTAILTQ